MTDTTVPQGDTFGALRNFVTNAQLLKTLVVMVIAAVAGGLAVYNHFAKASDIEELACKVVYQNDINNDVLDATNQIRAALNTMKVEFESSTRDRPISAEAIAKGISEAVGKIDKSIEQVNQHRKAFSDRAIMKDFTKCRG
ncbi:MAG: hypothetical protein ABI907_01485 [Ramlibacter sp.]